MFLADGRRLWGSAQVVVRRVEREIPAGMTASDLGQASVEALSSVNERFVLVSYLTSPVPERTKLDYVLFARPPEATDVDIDVDEYRWTVTSPTDPAFAPMELKTDTGCFWWSGQRAGHQYTVSVTARLGGEDLATASLLQSTRQRDAQLETKLKKKRKDPGEPDSQRELINDFGDYIRSAAAATGVRGVSARVLAAILYMEINARPKDGTKRAQLYRARTRINRNPTWSEWTSEESQQWLKQKVQDNVSKKVTWRTDFFPLTEIRCVELTLVGDMFDDALIGLRSNIFGGKSLGVGQVAMSTAAMVTGAMPWVDGTPGELDKARQDVDEAWRKLSLSKQVDIFNLLRFPKSNIRIAANYLDRLKNRPNRHSAMLAANLWKDDFAVSLLATEYNQGATNSALADAKLPTKADANWRRAIRFVKPDYPCYPEIFFP